MSPTPGPTWSRRGRSWTLTLIVLQEPVRPHVPHLHCVVHAGGSNARAAGVEVHVGDKAGKTGATACYRRVVLAQNRPENIQHFPTPAYLLRLPPQPRIPLFCPVSLPGGYGIARRGRTEASNKQRWPRQGANPDIHFYKYRKWSSVQTSVDGSGVFRVGASALIRAGGRAGLPAEAQSQGPRAPQGCWFTQLQGTGQGPSTHPHLTARMISQPALRSLSSGLPA